jgi:outer membrane protein OmpA-like peptidoglycan-associated protein
MLNPLSLYLSTLLVLILSLPALASQNCDEATQLVIQAYDWGELGDKDKEKQLLNQALQGCPHHAQANNNLASLLEDEGNYAQAITHYRQALQNKPNYSIAWYGLGETYYKQGQFPLSLEAHLHACQTDKDSKQRVKELLKNNRYGATEAGQILNKESLLLLYDPARRQSINRLIAACGFKLARVKPAATFRNFQFDTGKATLQPGTERQLEALVAALINLPNRTVEIHGHTDIQPFAGFTLVESKKLNKILSDKRAATVADALNSRGIDKTRLKIYGHGQEQPLIPVNSPDAWAKNRRVEIKVK